MDSTSPKLARGWKRYQELRVRDAADKAEIERGLLADLGRAPTTNDRLACEDIAALTIVARIYERRGQFAKAAAIRDQITRTRRTNNIRPEPAAASPKSNANAGLDYLREKYGSEGAR
jgi:hypothetical protein